MTAAALVAAAVLAAAHVGARRLAFTRAQPRHWAMSVLGGVSLAYAFVHLLPEVAAAQRHLGGAGPQPWAFVLALGGALAFYGVDHHSRIRTLPAAPPVRTDESTTADAFWLSMCAFAAYNAFIGMLLVHTAERRGMAALVSFTVALALHFVVNDVALRGHHARRYDTMGRWILAAAVPAGWAAYVLASPGEVFMAAGVSIVAGGVTLNVLKEELPSGRAGHFTALGGAAVVAAALLLLTA